MGQRHRQPARSAPSSRRRARRTRGRENSRENRLTPFANDPVVDPTGEALFIRDDETGRRRGRRRRDRCPDAPRAATASSVMRPASTTFSRVDATASTTSSTVFVDVDDPVKFSLLTLTNDGDAARRLSLFALQRLGARAAARRSAGARHDELDARARSDLRAQRLQRRFRAAASRSRTPARRRGRRPAIACRSSAATDRLARPGGAAARDARAAVRRRARSVRGAARRR